MRQLPDSSNDDGEIMGKASNMIVDVGEYKACAADVKKTCALLDDVISTISDELKTANSVGLSKGESAESFADFVKIFNELRGKLKEAGENIDKNLKNFLHEIDEIDDTLFGNSGYKPFTDEEFFKCFTVVENTVAPSEGIHFFSKLFDRILKLIWKSADYEVTVNTESSVLAKRVDKLKEKTVIKVTEIKTGVRTADRVYGRILNNLMDSLIEYKQVVELINSIAVSGGDTINPGILARVEEAINQINEVAKASETVPDKDVKRFADNVEGYFSASVAVIGAVCEESVGQLAVGDFEKYRATVNEAREYFNSFSKDYTASREQLDKYKDTFSECLELYNKYGSKWADNYNGDKINAELFNKIIKESGSVIKKADDYEDIWFQLFCDMSESKAAFERFKSNCDLDNESVKKALTRIEELYDNKIDAYVKDTLETIAGKIKESIIKEGVDGATKLYSDLVPVDGVGTIVKNVVGSFADKVFAEAPAVAKYDYILSAENAFNNAVAKLKAASPGDSGYDELVLTVRETFNQSKKAQLDFYNTMAKNTSGQLKDFCLLNAKTVETMSLDDVTAYSAVNPDDYFGDNSSIIAHIFDGDVNVKINY